MIPFAVICLGALLMGAIKKCGPRDPQPRLIKKQQDL